MKTYGFLTMTIAAALVLLTACASAPKGPKFAETPIAAVADRAVVVVYRYNASPMQFSTTLLVDNTPVTTMVEKTFVVLELAPGHHQIVAKWSPLALKSPAQTHLEVRAGQIYYLALDGVTSVGRDTGGSNVLPSIAVSNVSQWLQVTADKAKPTLDYCCVLVSRTKL